MHQHMSQHRRENDQVKEAMILAEAWPTLANNIERISEKILTSFTYRGEDNLGSGMSSDQRGNPYFFYRGKRNPKETAPKIYF